MLQRTCRSARRCTRYSLLTVGDGLVSQIPALLISLSSGLIVTRATTEEDIGTDAAAPVPRHKRALHSPAAPRSRSR